MAKTGTISGRVWADSNSNGSYDDGEGVGNMSVEAFKMSKKFDEYAGGAGGGPMGGGGDWAMASSSNITATKGNFTLRVNSGAWVVNVRADPGMMSGGYSSNSVNYIYTGSPVEVNISSTSQTSTSNNFRLGIADATIQGRVIDDASGDTVSGIWGYAFAESATSFNQGPMMGTGMGGPVSSSSFTLKVPAGSYRVGVDFPSESSGYTTADMAAVTAVSGATANVDVRVKPNNATIRVRFKNTSGNLITDLNYAEVFLDNGSGGHQWKHFSSSDLSSGLANILVSAGNWRVGYNIDPTTSSYMSEPSTNNQVTAVASQIVIKDITLR